MLYAQRGLLCYLGPVRGPLSGALSPHAGGRTDGKQQADAPLGLAALIINPNNAQMDSPDYTLNYL